MSSMKIIKHTVEVEDHGSDVVHTKSLNASGFASLIRDVFRIPEDAIGIDLRVLDDRDHFESGDKIALSYVRLMVRWKERAPTRDDEP